VDSNDGIAFTTVTEEKETNKSEKKKGITCFKCKKKGTTQMNVPMNCL